MFPVLLQDDYLLRAYDIRILKFSLIKGRRKKERQGTHNQNPQSIISSSSFPRSS